MEIHGLNFNGGILVRGFWLYIWKVTNPDGKVLFYVGRTGDSSSRFASSPFSRLGQHLDLRANATANCLLRNIRYEGFEPETCDFELLAIGPIFSEQDTIEKHREYRDVIAPLETALAAYLRGKGYQVIGKHPKPRAHNEDLFTQVLAKLKNQTSI